MERQRRMNSAQANEIFDAMDSDNNGVIDRKEFSSFMSPSPVETPSEVMEVVAQRLGTLEASMVRFIEEGERENRELRELLAEERSMREANEKRLWAKLEQLEAGAGGAGKAAGGPARKELREVQVETARLKDHVEHLSKQTTALARAAKQGKSSGEASVLQVERKLEEESQRVTDLEGKLQCTVEALKLLNTQSSPDEAEGTSSELVRLEAWIAEEAMQRRRLQEKLSSCGMMDSPQPNRLGASLGSRGSPAVSEVSDECWAGLESTLNQIEGAPAAKGTSQDKRSRGGDPRVALLEQAVRELTEQVGRMEFTQRDTPQAHRPDGAASGELTKRLERLEKKQQAQRPAEQVNAEFERVREAIETVNRVLSLRLEKLDRQISTIKRRSDGGKPDERQVAALSSQLQEQKGQMGEMKAKLEMLAQATASQKESAVQRSASRERRPDDGKPKMNDRVTYLESQCDGIEVALRGCLEDVSGLLLKADTQGRQLSSTTSSAESEGKLLGAVSAQVEELHGEVQKLKEREEEKANGMLVMVDQLEQKVQALDELPSQLTRRVDEVMLQKGGVQAPPGAVAALSTEVHNMKVDMADDRSKVHKLEARVVEVSDRVSCIEADELMPPSAKGNHEFLCYDNPARASAHSLHPEHLAAHPESPPSPPPRSRYSKQPPRSGSRAWQHEEPLVVDLHEHRASTTTKRRSSRSSHRAAPPPEEDAENLDPRREWPEDAPSPKTPKAWRSSRRGRAPRSPELGSPEPASPGVNDKECLRSQLSEMMNGISNLSDRFKGIDPIARNAQAALQASAKIPDSRQQPQHQQTVTPATQHANPLAQGGAGSVFDSIDTNQDGLIDRGEFKKAYTQANTLVSIGNTIHQEQKQTPSKQMLGTPPLPARPSQQQSSNDYLELRKKLLNSRS